MILLRLSLLTTIAAAIMAMMAMEYYAFFIVETYGLSIIIIIHRLFLLKKEKRLLLVNFTYLFSIFIFSVTLLYFLFGYANIYDGTFPEYKPAPYTIWDYAFPFLGSVIIPVFYFWKKRFNI